MTGSPSSLAPHDERAQALAEVGVRDADHGRVGELRVAGERVLDLLRVHVLAARQDHVVVAAVDEQAAGRVEVADVADRHQAVDDLARAAAGVAVEHEPAADEDAARRRRAAARGRRSSSTFSVVPRGGRPTVPGAARRSAGPAHEAKPVSVEP